MELVDALKAKGNVTMSDIAELLFAIGAPGELREDKISAVKSLGIKNFQGIGLEETITDYQEF